VVVIGGSAGAIAALRELFAGLPRDLPAAVFVVVHISPESPALLADALARTATMPVHSARDGMAVKHGEIVVAPPDRHLLLQDGVVRLNHGPRENRHRPAIDALFRSAAVAYEERVIGIVLSGMLDDGAAGLWAVKRRGGVAMVQDPDKAEHPDMPRNAMEATAVDFFGAPREIAARVSALAGQAARPAATPAPDLKYEADMEVEQQSEMDKLDRLGERTPFTCPECGGTMWELDENGNPRFRCHVGHAYSLRTLAAEQTMRVEAALWAALRSLEENERLSRRMATDAGRRGNKQSERYHEESAAASAVHAEALRDMLAQAEPQPPAQARRRTGTKRRS
jgi:two-component system chemotaxis response regulator CheB